MPCAHHSKQPASKPAPLVSLRNLSVRFGSITALHIPRWQLHTGQHWAVVGHNGAGKSTLLRCIRGEQHPSQASKEQTETIHNVHCDSAGTDFSTSESQRAILSETPCATIQMQSPVIWNTDGTPETTPLAIRKRIATVSAEMQEHYVRQQWRMDGEELLLSGFFDSPMLYQSPSDTQRQRAMELARTLDVTHLLDMQVPAMSQGQLRKLLIARALVNSPAIMVLDEVCEGLDAQARETVLFTIDKAAQLGTHLLFTTHRLDELPQAITHALILRQGQIAYAGPLAESPLAQAATDLPEPVSSVSTDIQTGALSDTLSGIQTGSECIRQSRKSIMTQPEALPPYSPQQLITGAPLLELIDTDVFIERQKVLHSINWRIMPQQQWAVSGGNGAGKSTLLRLLLGDERQAWGGEVRWFGSETPVSITTLRQRIGYVSDKFQATYGHDKYHSTLLDITGFELVLSGFTASVGVWAWKQASREQQELANKWLTYLGLADYAEQPIRSMSYGRLRRFMLCRAVAPSPSLLLLDEPCSGLDPAARRHFLATLQQLIKAGLHIVYVTHRPAELLPEITHHLMLENGKVRYSGPVSDTTAKE